MVVLLAEILRFLSYFFSLHHSLPVHVLNVACLLVSSSFSLLSLPSHLFTFSSLKKKKNCYYTPEVQKRGSSRVGLSQQHQVAARDRGSSHRSLLLREAALLSGQLPSWSRNGSPSSRHHITTPRPLQETGGENWSPDYREWWGLW